jgi:hypothetical protein
MSIWFSDTKIIKKNIYKSRNEKQKYAERKRRNIVSIDLGIRTFSTGVSDYEVIKIGENINDIIKHKLNGM